MTSHRHWSKNEHRKWKYIIDNANHQNLLCINLHSIYYHIHQFITKLFELMSRQFVIIWRPCVANSKCRILSMHSRTDDWQYCERQAMQQQFTEKQAIRQRKCGTGNEKRIKMIQRSIVQGGCIAMIENGHHSCEASLRLITLWRNIFEMSESQTVCHKQFSKIYVLILLYFTSLLMHFIRMA